MELLIKTRSLRHWLMLLHARTDLACANEAPGLSTYRLMFGSISSILDGSSEESTPGRPAVIPDGYGPGTRSCRTWTSLDTDARGPTPSLSEARDQPGLNQRLITSSLMSDSGDRRGIVRYWIRLWNGGPEQVRYRFNRAAALRRVDNFD